ncbi:hypothetical protein D2Q93_02820 [Alicyclobacillaceae bacterium I2511]|jgi:hypothetical protein|nr:hypothetical protein D2Q93_02820 [Alicyclobacillaceae bacterium I2511]
MTGAFGGYTRWAVVFLIIFVLFFLLVPGYPMGAEVPMVTAVKYKTHPYHPHTLHYPMMNVAMGGTGMMGTVPGTTTMPGTMGMPGSMNMPGTMGSSYYESPSSS